MFRISREGVVADQAEIARLGFVTRARVTQIMNLLNLAPEIQTALLKFPVVSAGRDGVTERDLRAITELAGWRSQMNCWTSRNHPPRRLAEK
jgi:hypothetical protein